MIDQGIEVRANKASEMAGREKDLLGDPSAIIDGPIDGPAFVGYVGECLAPMLQWNDIMVMDKPPAHKDPGGKGGMEDFAATVQYLPQYSPDLNPIEMPFSKFKAFLRKVSERTVRGLFSCQPSVVQNVATTSDMPATRPYDRNLL